MTLDEAIKPNLSLLMKLGSLIVHYEEFQSEKRHEFDLVAIETLRNDLEVREWFAVMSKNGMVSVKR